MTCLAPMALAHIKYLQMSIDNKSRQLSFPCKDLNLIEETLVIRDVDIVGAGSLRRQQVEELQKTKKIILQTHEHNISLAEHQNYYQELEQTLKWLKPVKIEKGSEFNFKYEQRNLFSRIFPLTGKLLGGQAIALQDAYIDEMEQTGWLLQDYWRYFVGFLRRKFIKNNELMEVAHWEWVQAWIEVQPFSHDSGEKDVVSLNPTLQTVNLKENNAELKKEKGLYAFWFDIKHGFIAEKKLDIYEANLIDLLEEDRTYSFDQILQRVQTGFGSKYCALGSGQDWEKKLLFYCAESFIIKH
ncbi:MAG: hypothetical protein ACXVCY_05505 [Pseudobdellovibrionaceae bacterium]